MVVVVVVLVLAVVEVVTGEVRVALQIRNLLISSMSVLGARARS